MPASPPRSQATVDTRPSTGSGHDGPACMTTKVPVPKVTLVIPEVKQACPNSAACWSPIMAVTGTPARSPSPSTPDGGRCPASPAEGRTSGGGWSGTPEGIGQLLRPSPVADVEEHGPRGVGHVGGEGAAARAAGQVPEHPCIDGAEGQLPVVLDAAFFEQPPHLGAREVGIGDESGPLPNKRSQATLVELAAGLERATVLPDDGPVPRGTVPPVPGHDGLPLIGDADGHGLAACSVELGRHLDERGPYERPDLGGVVLDPSRPREVLGQLAVGGVEHPGLVRPPPGLARRWCRHRRR